MSLPDKMGVASGLRSSQGNDFLEVMEYVPNKGFQSHQFNYKRGRSVVAPFLEFHRTALNSPLLPANRLSLKIQVKLIITRAAESRRRELWKIIGDPRFVTRHSKGFCNLLRKFPVANGADAVEDFVFLAGGVGRSAILQTDEILSGITQVLSGLSGGGYYSMNERCDRPTTLG